MGGRSPEVHFAPGGDPATAIISAIAKSKTIIRAALFVITDPDIRPSIRPCRALGMAGRAARVMRAGWMHNAGGPARLWAAIDARRGWPPRHARASMAPLVLCCSTSAVESATRRSTAGRQPAGISRAKSEKSGVILRDPENRFKIG
jgi:hypothetical protein